MHIGRRIATGTAHLDEWAERNIKMMVNQIVLAGRIATDPVLRRTQNGKAVTSVRLAHHRDTDAQADFYDIVAWDVWAEVLADCKKGQLITVTGALVTRYWTDSSTGRERSQIQVKADTIAVSPWEPKKKPTVNPMNYAPRLDASYSFEEAGQEAGDDT